MNASNVLRLNAILAFSLNLSACGGTKVLKEPSVIPTDKPLIVASDSRVGVALDWVIVRDGPGTWARNADWDEYLVTVTNRTDRPVKVLDLAVVDSLGTTIDTQAARKELVRGSKETVRRYKGTGIEVKAGAGTATLLATGTAVTAVGVAATYAAAYSSLTTGTAAGSAGSAAGGLVLLGPALVVGGIVRGVNNSKVNTMIEERSTPMPVQVSPGQHVKLNVFYPLTPSPRQLTLLYEDHEGEHVLAIDTRDALEGLNTIEQTSEHGESAPGIAVVELPPGGYMTIKH